jgi:hypothetical protein
MKISIDQNYSLISTAGGGAEGVDLLIDWKQRYVDEADVHQFKDQRQTPEKKWNEKWNSFLDSPLDATFFPDCTFSIHFIFAGREHSMLSGENRIVLI